MNMNPSNDVWVFVEQRDGKPSEVSLELLSKGRKLAYSLKSTLKSVVIGYQVQGIAKETFKYGASEALTIDHPNLTYYKSLPYSRILIELVEAYKPRIILYGATSTGRDLAPRVASHTRSGLTADCTDLRISDVTYLRRKYKNLLLQIRPAFGGNIIATIISPMSQTQMATVREGVMEIAPVKIPGREKITEIPYRHEPLDDLVRIVSQHKKETKVNLKPAPIIVAGGYGMGTKENFQLIHKLAHTIGGEVAGSRAAIDAGFTAPERQVGQTGITVRPKLYIACGISGAIQHIAGMQNSQKIIAINTDPDAPIFNIAHYKIVGDVNEVIPILIDTYRHKLK